MSLTFTLGIAITSGEKQDKRVFSKKKTSLYLFKVPREYIIITSTAVICADEGSGSRRPTLFLFIIMLKIFNCKFNLNSCPHPKQILATRRSNKVKVTEKVRKCEKKMKRQGWMRSLLICLTHSPLK